MADGKGTRWQNYNDIPKHFIEINGETLLHRTVRLINEHGGTDEREIDNAHKAAAGHVINGENEHGVSEYAPTDIVITSHDPRYEVEGARRYEPLNNVLEVDRFTAELIEDDICFLYGDTFYSEETMSAIMDTPVEDMLFFGNQKSIVAVKIKDGELFRSHVNRVRELFTEGKIKNCKGWQVYRSFAGLDIGADDYREIREKFITVDNKTDDFNTPEDFEKISK